MDCAKKVVSLAKKNKLTLALAESATAGYTSYLITKVPGSSKILKGSLVVYAPDSKEKFFNIPKTILEKSKGVSKPISITMAKRVAGLFNANYGISIVGFAGPESMPGIEPGTFFATITDGDKYKTFSFKIKGKRNQVRKQAAKMVLEKLLKIMKSKK
jgi:PncC family amidohydrolase